MKKGLCAILAVGLVLLLNGCGERQAANPSSVASTIPDTDAVDTVYRIIYQWTMLANDSVGNDWEKTVTCNGQSIDSGDTVTVAKNSRITIEGTITEHDKYPDTGNGAIELALRDGAQGAAHITVYEGHGQYAGNTAEWKLTCCIDHVE